ncbi:hypothetical protein VKT23_016184 [Stygiomarasmius scandens]|uniref:2-nitropropane dioxygenase n=1 Tax=Marasmiellus scandens TaxID=2682957 RepID=A0ABR1IXP0_9AGAR
MQNMQQIQTALTRLLGISTPIVLAPMGAVVSPEMAAAVTLAGGFGFLGAALATSVQIKQRIQAVRKILGAVPEAPLPIGVGVIGWCLDKTELGEDPLIPTILAERPKAIWLAFGDNLGRYVKTVREYDANRNFRTLIFVIVNSVEDATKAANVWGVDVLVAQGIESGGHGGSKAPTLSILLTAILRVIPQNGPVVIGAGGIATGAQIASLLTTGASGVALGTRFLFTHEAQYSAASKEVLLAAGIHSTERSMAFDEVNRTMGWPRDIDGRAIANKIMDDLKEGISLKERMERHDSGKENGEKDRLVVWAGMAVGLTDQLKCTADVVKELHEETLEFLKRAASLIPAS